MRPVLRDGSPRNPDCAGSLPGVWHSKLFPWQHSRHVVQAHAMVRRFRETLHETRDSATPLMGPSPGRKVFTQHARPWKRRTSSRDCFKTLTVCRNLARLPVPIPGKTGGGQNPTAAACGCFCIIMPCVSLAGMTLQVPVQTLWPLL